MSVCSYIHDDHHSDYVCLGCGWSSPKQLQLDLHFNKINITFEDLDIVISIADIVPTNKKPDLLSRLKKIIRGTK
jgi:hypothetical protein